MSIESLKEQARRHEQREEWQKALDLYSRAIGKLAEEDQPDIGLYNRAGDLCIRIGNLEAAVEHYEQALDLYLEAELPNSAIAICKKVIRNLPHRHSVYLKMGQIRAEQGFLPDARANFLEYAERMQREGELDESFRALVEFADLAPEDVEVRLAVAEQMASNERVEEAVEQLSIAYRTLRLRGDGARAAEVEEKIHALDPDADLSAAIVAPSGGEMIVTGNSLSDDGEILGSFGEIAGAGAGAGADSGHEEAAEPSPWGGVEGLGAGPEEEETTPLPTLDGVREEAEEAQEAQEGQEAQEEAEPLPTLDAAGEEEEEEEAEPLPTLELGEEEEEGEVTPLPTLDLGDEAARRGVEVGRELLFGGEPEGSSEARESAFEEAAAGARDEATLEAVRAEIASRPDDVALHQRMVEMAYREGAEDALAEAYLGLAGALLRTGQTARANAAYQQVLEVDPDNDVARTALGKIEGRPETPVREVASSEDYVDLGSLVLGDESERTTRFVVAYEEPSGDEAADFAKMLNRFKEKVAENLESDDVRAHHDLGTAYKEMGLLDEAITEFQQALRASADHLPTYELLGQTFLEMGNGNAAVRSLKRALEVPFEVEDELVGIYYYLARAYELVGDKEAALEYYDQVFSLDINFADVTERLRALR